MDRRDHVHHVLEQWRREAPKLDRSPLGVVGRISRLAQLIQVELERVFESYGLNGGEFDVLATLRRTGRPYRLTPTELSRALMVTSGGMTKRLAALDYDFDRLRDLMLRRDWTTVALVWRASDTRFDVRNPFPVGGVVEDPATGAAAAALGGYLRTHGLVEPPTTLRLHQGADLGRPGLLVVDVPAGTGGIRVTGTAVVMPG